MVFHVLGRTSLEPKRLVASPLSVCQSHWGLFSDQKVRFLVARKDMFLFATLDSLYMLVAVARDNYRDLRPLTLCIVRFSRPSSHTMS